MEAAERATRLEELAEQARACTRCPLHGFRTQAVPGEGPAHAQVVLVGEAPGRNEDETGRPFCGAAGKNLDLALQAAGIARSDVFVTSSVKCRPPGNRDPTDLEKASCRPYLQEQLALIRPRVLVALGRHGLHGLLGEMPQEFAELAGSFVEGPDGIPVFVSYHPAAIIYRQKWKPAYLEHWRAFGEWLRSGAPAPLRAPPAAT